MSFVKLDTGILESTLWFDKDARDLFLTALLMARPIKLDNDKPQIDLRSNEPTGWLVPPGWYGWVEASGIAIIKRAQVTDDDTGYSALIRLGNPEIGSRSVEYDGRRLVRVNGGFVVLNYMRYRQKDHTVAARQKRYRERKKEQALVNAGAAGVDSDRDDDGQDC